MAKLTGTNPDQVPTNADLGTMAYQDKDNLQVGDVYANGILKSDQGAGHIIVKHDGVNGSISNNTGQLLMYAEGAGSIINHTNGVERMRIDSAGNVGIGTQSPSAPLETVQAGQTNTAIFENTNASWANDVAFLYSPSGSTASNLSLSNRSNGDTWIGSGFGPIRFQLDENENNSRSTKVTIQSNGYLTLNGNDIGGTQVTIADDAVASITPPRKGGFMFVTTNGASDYPLAANGAVLYYDVGASLQLNRQTFAGVSGNADVVTTDVTGTTGTDGKVTYAAQTGVIKIENRYGGAVTFQITFL